MHEQRKPLFERLQKVSLSLLDGSRPAYSLRNEVLELKSIFEASGGLKADTTENIARGETVTPGGIAISPTMAAMCVEDFARTVEFIRGTHDAINDIASKTTGRPVRVLYAGCGPWAPIAVPVMTVLTPAEALFTLLDIHQESIDSTRRMIESLRLHDHVFEFEVADATTYEINPGEPPDVIVIEMLRTGLQSEPQVAVAEHLIRQAPGAIMIPVEVMIDLVLLNPAREFELAADAGGDQIERDRIHVGRVMTIDRATLLSPERGIPSSELRLPDHDPTRYQPMLCTTIRIYGDHVLKDYDSGITCPGKVPIEGEILPGDSLRFSYRRGKRPGLTAERVV